MVANWKMHKTIRESEAFVRELMRQLEEGGEVATDQIICPTLPALSAVTAKLAGTSIRTGAQTLDLGREGANTGAVSAYLIREAGASVVILGHSERRSLYGEDDALVAEKTASAVNVHLTPIICVGESQSEREQGKTDAVIRRQVSVVVERLAKSPDAAVIFAYEPLWAIGTGLVAEPKEADRVAGLIKELAHRQSPRVLYGGSVNAANAAALASQPHLDGALVGGASLKVSDWIALNRAWGEGVS